jgi:transposase
VATLGKSYLITNHPETTPLQDLVWMFRQQTTVERAFAYLKCPEFCAARPIFHHCDDSIQGHLFICVLGLLLMTLLTREVNQSEPTWSLNEIRDKLLKVEAVSIKYPGNAKAQVQLANIKPDAQYLVDQLQLMSYL